MSSSFDAARQAWPGVELDLETFTAFVASRDSSHSSDLYLACALTRGDVAAMAYFEKDLVPALAQALPKDVNVDEVTQRLRLRLFLGEAGSPPRMSEYAGRGPLLNWLKVAALRIASNVRRAEAPHEREQEPVELLPPMDTELALIKARCGDAFSRAMRIAFDELPADDRAVFRLHFVEGLNIERIGALRGVHRATVARWIAATREQLFARIVELLEGELRLTGKEVDSLIALVRSQADVSLRSLLAD